MIKREDMFLRNFSGILMYKNIPLFYFNIENGRLVSYTLKKKDKKYFPFEFSFWDISYKTLNSFFRERVVLDGSQDIRQYLNELGLEKYDFEKIVKLNSGRNYLDEYWVDMEKTE